MTNRLSSTIGAILVLLLSIVLTMPMAKAQDYYETAAPYPYFRRTSSSSSTQPVPVPSSGVSVSSTPTVGLSIEADRSEANPGDDVRYWVKARNLYNRDLPQWKVAFFFDPKQMQILETGGGRLEGDHVTFNVPAMSSNQERSFTVRVHLYRNLQPGMSLRTYGSMIWPARSGTGGDGTISPACSKNDLVIIARPPVTGIGDNTSPVENLQAFLRPVSAATNGSPMPLMAWTVVAVAGLGLGGGLAKKFI